MTAPRHVLFVAFHYPPEASSSGMLRSLKFTTYLVESGWRATVLAPSTAAYDVVDEALASSIPDVVRVLRTPFRNVKRHFSIAGRYPAVLAIPDTWIPWYPWAVAAANDVYRSDPFDLIYSTSPHATAHVIAARVASRSGRPWVTDFRDPWVEEPPEPGAPRGLVYRAANRRLEARVIRRCDHVVTTTGWLRQMLLERYASLSPHRITCIPNGFDEADFARLVIRPRTDDRFTIVHAGALTPDFRDPRPFFLALRAAADRGWLDPSRVRVRFLGAGPWADSPPVQSLIRSCGLQSNIEFAPRIAYAEALSEMTAADLLLLIQASEDTRGLVPAKLYEYFRAGKPVLALVLPGECETLVRDASAGWAVNPHQSGELLDALRVAYSAWTAGSLRDHAVRADTVRRFDRRTLTAQLAEVFDGVVSQRDAREPLDR